MKILVEPGASKNILATIAIGDEYFNSWQKYALPTWEKYCETYDLGLVVFDKDLVSKEDPFWKKATWQKMLIADTLHKSSLQIENVCFLDSDMLINFFAPNIFDEYNAEKIGLVSLRNGLPQPIQPTLRRMAFMRHTYYDDKYPLDSALFMKPTQIFEYHNLPVQEDFACMGLIVFNVENHRKIMKAWFEKYDRNVESLTNGGDQSHMNYEIQNWGKVVWLNYKYQAIWTYEMAWKYPFLYDYGRGNERLIKECVESSLFTNYFLHFAGSWQESEMWKIEDILDKDKQDFLEKYYRYLEVPVTGLPRGTIKPVSI